MDFVNLPGRVFFRIKRQIKKLIRPTALDLRGDRDVEWSWVAAQIPDNPGKVLDFGCGSAFLGFIATRKGGEVIGLDRQEINLPFRINNLEIQKGDILDFNFKSKKFDVIINCSSIEHVGLLGRYGSTDEKKGDLFAMERLRQVLKAPDGIMILTVPVGKDAVFLPLHRVYGTHRLNLLLRGFRIVNKEFWVKNSALNIWVRVDEKDALSAQPSKSFYALGLFVLKTNNSIPQDGE
jgi:SAM-dependent methyltransferase